MIRDQFSKKNENGGTCSRVRQSVSLKFLNLMKEVILSLRRILRGADPHFWDGKCNGALEVPCPAGESAGRRDDTRGIFKQSNAQILGEQKKFAQIMKHRLGMI